MSLPKYQQIAEVLREKIIKGTYAVGNVIPTEAKLQEQFDVSRHTIRQALSILINEGYLRSEKGSGTYVKNRLIESTNNNSTRKIGVITTYLSDYIFPNIIRGIEEVLRQNNYSLVLASTDNDIVQEEICLKRMLDEEVAGLIVEPTKSNLFNPNIAYYSKFKELGIPILFINAYYETLDLPYIAMDDRKAAQKATEFWLKQGITNIGLITKIDDLQGKLRMKGFIKAFEEKGVSFSKEAIHTYTTETLDADLANIANQILNDETTTRTFVCYNDKVALKLQQLVESKSPILGSKLQLSSHDNSILSVVGGFSSVQHIKDELGRIAANKIIESIEKNKAIETEIFVGELVER